MNKIILVHGNDMNVKVLTTVPLLALADQAKFRYQCLQF